MQVSSINSINAGHEAKVLEKYQVTWNEYEVKLLALALKVRQSGWVPDYILSIGRGGFTVGDALSRLLHKTVGVVMCSSYGGEGERFQGQLKIAEHVSIIGALKGRVLVVDDLVDSGKTLKRTKDFLLEKFPSITEIKTGVVFTKPCTTVDPDYSVEMVKEGVWIYLPYEVFDRIKLDELPQEVLANVPEENLPILAKALLENLSEDPSENLPIETIQSLATPMSR